MGFYDCLFSANIAFMFWNQCGNNIAIAGDTYGIVVQHVAHSNIECCVHVPVLGSLAARCRTKLSRREGGLGKVAIPLLSDLTHQISKDYGVLLEKEGHTLRGLFIIDENGILRQITMNDLPVGRSVDETIRLIQAFRYTDDHGEVCPAGWKPGADTVGLCARPPLFSMLSSHL